MNRLNAFSLFVAASFLAGCALPEALPASAGAAPPPAATARVAGTVTYRERIALPPTAVIKVQLVDVSRADAPATVVGEQRIVAGGNQVPFAFAIDYDPATIVASHSYAVQARIEDEGRLRFISDQRHAVITRGAPTRVEMVLRAVDAR